MMMGVKGKLIKKLKTIKSIGYLTPERNLQVNALDGSRAVARPLPLSVLREAEAEEEGHHQKKQRQKQHSNDNSFPVQQPEIVDVSELMKDLDDQEIGFVDDDDDEMDGKENLRPEAKGVDSSESWEVIMRVRPPLKAKDEVEEGRGIKVEEREGSVPLFEIDVSSFRRPDLNSRTLFDPRLLEAFEQAVMEVKAREAERRSRTEAAGWWEEEEEDKDEDVMDELKTLQKVVTADPLLEFEEKCPPGGSDSIVLYTTGLRAIRKTFEDCQKMRSLLENLRVLFSERDVSMHSGFKEEVREILGEQKMVPPRLFIKGRYIGGVDQVLGLHEQGMLKPLIEGIPRHDNDQGPCQGCLGFRFVVCSNCHGSRKIVAAQEENRRCCSECNENGVMICPVCC